MSERGRWGTEAKVTIVLLWAFLIRDFFLGFLRPLWFSLHMSHLLSSEVVATPSSVVIPHPTPPHPTFFCFLPCCCGIVQFYSHASVAATFPNYLVNFTFILVSFTQSHRRQASFLCNSLRNVPLGDELPPRRSAPFFPPTVGYCSWTSLFPKRNQISLETHSRKRQY